MRVLMLLIIVSLYIVSCVGLNESENSGLNISQDTILATDEGTENQNYIDTIIERNNPDSLDLNLHQVFIDTTKNSEYFDRLKNWKPSETLKETVEKYKSNIFDSSITPEFDLKGFPTEWVVLKKFKGEFLIHSPCNGIGGRFILSKNSVDYYSLEPETDLITSIDKISSDHLILRLKVHSDKSEETRTAVFSIRKTKFEHIFLEKTVYDHTIGYDLITPLSKIDQFNLLVENCNELVNFQITFDQIDYEWIEKNSLVNN